MSKADDIQRLVRIVSDGLRQNRSEAQIVASLVTAGVPVDNAPPLFAAVKQAIQAGVQAAFTEGISAPAGLPTDPLLAEAFRQGQAALRVSVRRVWVERGLVAVVALVVVAAAVTRLLGLWGD